MTDKDNQLFTIPEAANYIIPYDKRRTSTTTESNCRQTKWVHCLYFNSSWMNDMKLKVCDQMKKEKTYYNACYGILALVVWVLGCCPATLIPMHNSVINPQYWYEVLVSFLPLTFFIAGSFVIRAQKVFNCFDNRLVRVTFDLCCSSFLITVVFCGLLHLIWTKLLGYIEPVPWKCIMMGYICTTIILIRLWHTFSKESIDDALFRRRRLAYFYYLAWGSFLGIQLLGLAKLFKEIPSDFQWVLGISVPLIKEINDRILEKLISRASSSETIFDAHLVAKIDAGILFSFWITIVLATDATQLTGYVLLGINSCINISLCLKAKNLERKSFPHQFDHRINQFLVKEVVTELVLNETIEILVPLSFIVSYATAFYGPNYDKLGSVGCNYWTFEKVEDINSFLTPVVFMEIVDFGTAVISGILLYRLCRINILKEYVSTIKRYWVTLAFSGAYNIISVNL